MSNLFLTAKKGKGLSSLIIQQIGRGNKQKRRSGNDGQEMPTAPRVERVNHQENVLINQFLNSNMFTQAQGNSTFNAFEQNM